MKITQPKESVFIEIKYTVTNHLSIKIGPNHLNEDTQLQNMNKIWNLCNFAQVSIFCTLPVIVTLGKGYHIDSGFFFPRTCC